MTSTEPLKPSKHQMLFYLLKKNNMELENLEAEEELVRLKQSKLSSSNRKIVQFLSKLKEECKKESPLLWEKELV